MSHHQPKPSTARASSRKPHQADDKRMYSVAPIAGETAERELVELQKNYLVRWTYDSIGWKRFAEAEWQKSRKAVPALAVATFVLCVIGGTLVRFLPPKHGRLVGANTMAYLDNSVLIGLGLGVAAAVLISAVALTAGKARYRQRLAQEPQACLGQNGYYVTGEYVYWNRDHHRLVAAGFAPDDANTLEVTIETPNCKGSKGRGLHMIPVPPKHRQAALQALACWQGQIAK
jgi:hypothetical protein